MDDCIQICTQCGYSHAFENRRRNIARMVVQEVNAWAIKQAWPCFYPHVKFNDAADRRLFRDIAAVKERAHG